MVLHVNAGKPQAEILADLLDRREEFRQLLQDAKSAARRRDLRSIIERLDDDIRNLDADILSTQVGWTSLLLSPPVNRFAPAV